jgi:hypothetical protein
VARLGRSSQVNIVLISKHERDRLLERSRRRWEYNIKLGSREIEWDGVEWNHLA